MSSAPAAEETGRFLRSPRRWVGFLALVPLWAGVLFGVFTGRWWTFSPGYHESTGYEDLRWIARWSECMASGQFQDVVRDCQIAYPLPGIWVASRLGFNQDHLVLVGSAMAVLWTVGASLLILSVARRSGGAWGLLLAAALCAPPTWLLLERGNLDILVWLVVLFALALLTRERPWGASFAIALAILLKVFPVGLMAGFLVGIRYRWRQTAPLISIPAACSLAIVGASRYVSDLRPNPVGDAFAAFHLPYLIRVGILVSQGADVEPASITTQIVPTFLDYSAGAGLLVLASLVAWLLLFRRCSIPQVDTCRAVVAAVGLVLFSYLTGSNFDYRLTFLAFIIAGIASLIANGRLPQRRSLLGATAIALAAAPWLGVGMPLSIQLAGDLALWVSLAISGALCIQIVAVSWRWTVGDDEREAMRGAI